MSKFNDWLAEKVTAGVGTMTCAYIFAGVSLTSLPAAIKTGDVQVIVSWIAQTFLQLVLLSVILVGQNLLQDKHDDLAASHEDLHAKVDALGAQPSN